MSGRYVPVAPARGIDTAMPGEFVQAGGRAVYKVESIDQTEAALALVSLGSTPKPLEDVMRGYGTTVSRASRPEFFSVVALHQPVVEVTYCALYDLAGTCVDTGPEVDDAARVRAGSAVNGKHLETLRITRTDGVALVEIVEPVRGYVDSGCDMANAAQSASITGLVGKRREYHDSNN